MKSALDKGPKLCLEPKLRPVAKLALVRGIAGKASFKDKKSDYFKDHDLKLLMSDKEGGFVVGSRDLFDEKSQQAVLKNFKKCGGLRPWQSCRIENADYAAGEEMAGIVLIIGGAASA
ncbi:hypothetical protein HPB47_023719 [Ixodes persulcatus]|uniref:Uncharacterized protein n=1 Tax=Ixodes persulcatus TaxID=34615 RepID=A0AC60Q6D4_IXOPE|nr:hypothetical protein HPB47_023719 [Ixodes persulcatus]